LQFSLGDPQDLIRGHLGRAFDLGESPAVASGCGQRDGALGKSPPCCI